MRSRVGGVVAALTCTLFLVVSGIAHGAIINGGFESGTLSGWSSLGTVGVSTGQDYGSAGSVAPVSGSYSAKLITTGASAAELATAMAVSESTLEASNSGVNATNGSLIWQSVDAAAGDSFQFRWNFVEQDYVPYDDWAFYGISLNGAPATLTKFASLATVGPETGSTVNGWETLTVTIVDPGTYTFYFGVVNALDTSLDSDLWIDGAYVGDAPPVPPDGATVPEPAVAGLVGLGLAVLGLKRFRKA